MPELPEQCIHDYFLTVRALDEISVSGAGNVDVSGVTSERLKVKLSGAGNVQVEALEADSLEVTISGAGGLAIEDGGGRVPDHLRLFKQRPGCYLEKFDVEPFASVKRLAVF